MIKSNLFILLIISCCQAGNICSLYPFNPIQCIQQTLDSFCQYNYLETKCIEFYQTDYGCFNNLNRKACIAQQIDKQNNEVRCLFQNKCMQTTNLHLITLGCDPNFSKFSCLNVINQDCIWQGECKQYQTQNYDQNIEEASCESYYNQPVTPYMCAKIQKLRCFHGGIKYDYKCITLLEEQLSEIKCSQIGLSKSGCISITTKDQNCIFKDNQCQFIDIYYLDSCDQIINKQTCLSSKINKLQCEWTIEGCRIFQNKNYQCSQIIDVNYFVCENYDGICSYNIETQSCQDLTPSQLNNLSCSTIGLSKQACLSIKNNNCTFYRGFCESLSEEDLNIFNCDMLLNEDACTNIKTQFQYCQWNGMQCERVFVNQSMNCDVNNDKNFKYNGLFCQNISNKLAACKYDNILKQCVPSSPDDFCNTSYLNFLGCLNIKRYNQTCQWTINGCRFIQILPFQTTCESLGHANPNACSQVIESLQEGCYYEKIYQKCQNVDQLQNQGQLLNSLDCENKQLGLNRILCASIIKPQTACRWYLNECVKIFSQKEISDVSCQELIYSNYQSCAMISFKQEPCRFESAAKGCINSVKKIMKCDTLGLNAFACAQLEDQCYFNQDQIECQLLQSQNSSSDSSQTPDSYNDQSLYSSLNNLSCIESSPTQKICKLISKPGQLCQWKETLDKCGVVIVSINQKCTEFKNVNSNVCGDVQMENPDFIPVNQIKPVGYCKYDSANNNCVVLEGNELCETNCCTESKFNGINQHSCSFLTRKSNSYCYFENYRCKELTSNMVDITDEKAVIQFFNANEMGKKSCHMIEWSTSQRCYFNGNSCININFENYNNFKIFTEEPSILNRYACLAIEASLTIYNSEKYFEYDPENHRCISKEYLNSPPYYARCEDVQGNSNICLRFTENNYCRWDKKLLKCVTMSQAEFEDITTCDQNQNIRACRENIHAPCFFSFDLDKCITAYTNVSFNYFDFKGFVSQKACSKIEFTKNLCEWQNYKCIQSNKSSTECDVTGANKYTCFKNTQGKCRWSKETSTCYQIATIQQIGELGCLDNLNSVLCRLVTKEPCMWDDSIYECVRFKQIHHTDFISLDKQNFYNALACLQITGAGYIYDEKNNKCTLIDNSKNQMKCQQMINQYACLYLTRGFNCVYDTTQMPPCQLFTDDQSECTTSNLINIQVCMDISKQCYFSKSKLQCLVADIPQSSTCSQLGDQVNNGNHYNKLSCSSIDELLTQSYSENQCYEGDEKKQQCSYEFNCEWHNQFYGCKVKQQYILFFDKENTIEKSVFEYRYKIDNCTNQCNKYITKQESYSSSYKVMFPGTSASLQCGINKTCDYQDKICQTNSDCSTIYINPIQINDDGTFNYGTKQNQLCTKKCQKSGDIVCNPSGQTYPLEITNDPIIQTQSCLGRCNSSNSYCSRDFECGLNIITEQEPRGNTTVPVEKAYQNICKNYECTQGKSNCQTKNDCPDYVSKSWDFSLAQCIKKTIYVIVPICKGFAYIELKCKNTFSKAVCLYGVLEECFFDINQGGCIQLKGNEHKVPNCSSISSRCKPTEQALECDPNKPICKNSTECQPNGFLNSCLKSSNQKVICKAGETKIIPDENQCFSLQRQIQQCETATVDENLQCDQMTGDVSPALCALAIDFCRFELDRCVSDKPLDQQNQYCGCVFDFIGFCQQKPLVPQLNPDGSNKYYLCHEVNQLNILEKVIICTMVEQACKFKDNKCEDATHSTCEQLKQSFTTKKACTLCQGASTYYDINNHTCQYILLKSVSQCSLLNKQACLQKTKDIMCKWENYECKQIDKITASDSRECSIYNREACIQFSYHCWFDINISYCTEFDPLQGDCKLLLNRDLCMYSLKQSCQWDLINKQCIIDNQEITQCKGLNKFGCLNQSILQCVWSDSYECEQAELNNNIQSCESPLSNIQKSYITNFSKRVCSSININQSCFLDNYYQCREIIITDKINCDSYGLNRFGCINRSIGQCQFIANDQKCIENLNNQIGCVDSLNKQACISQKQTCKFDNNICTFHQVNTINDIINSNSKFAYSKTVCSSLDQNLKNSLIYSEIQNRCIDVSNRQPFIDNCYRFTTNKYSCQQKTLQTCEYDLIDNNCIKTSQQTLKTINNCFTEKYLNWVSCISLLSNCKFNGEKCLPIDLQIDTCQYLYQQQYIVKDKVCAITNDQSCKLNVNTNTCEIVQITDNFQCSTPGLNKKSCIFQTKGYLCRFENDQCIFDYGYALCEDMINEEKCYSIRIKGQHCIFDQIKGCQQIDNTQIDLNKCIHSFKTNPITCSRSTDIACFYDIETKKCIVYKNPEDKNQTINQNYFIQNLNSFNLLACSLNNIVKSDQINTYGQLKTKWIGECIETLISEATTLKCNDKLNEPACLSIQTPFQYCIFLENQCQFQDPQNFKSSNCNTIQKVNSGIFCQINETQACRFNNQMKSCEIVTSSTSVQCVDTKPEFIGYNKKACELKPQECTFSNGCYQIKATQNIKLCNEFSVDECNKAMREGCKRDQNKCLSINPTEYSQLECSQVANLIGCLTITTEKQFCQYNELTKSCQLIKLDKTSGFCKSLSAINSQVPCENTIDIPCKYNPLEHKCENAQGEIEFQCIRGLNQIACLTLTQQSLQCQFYHYCYGPNYNILNCDPTKIKDCCQLAITIESCLFQDQFQCQWLNEECKQYSEQNQKCLSLINVSRKVCYNIKDSFCIFNLDKLGCIDIEPDNCEQVQTKEQCIQFINLPCYWDFIKEQCLQKLKNPNDGCQDIQDQWGSERSCLDVEKQGEMCIFQNKCSAYMQSKKIGCSQKLNKQSCLQQVLNECIWDQKQKQICLEFNKQSNQQCDSNLSYLACLSVRTPNTFCQWKDKECKNVENNQIISLSSFAQVNCNTCRLINDGSSVVCDTQNFKCLKVHNLRNLTCDVIGMNKQACLNIKDYPCKWDDINKICLKYESSDISCQIKNTNPLTCSIINLSLPCGSKGSDCDYVDITKISCDYPGLNEYACLQITNYPCGWVYNNFIQQYQCKLIKNFDACLGYNHQVNALVCTSIMDVPCFYNSSIRNCILFKVSEDNRCNQLGINSIGCSIIDDCVYLNGRCEKYDKNMNLKCEDALYANNKVCSQIETDRCKYNILGNGCIPSELNDICSTKGINKLGCNDLIDCQWNYSKCQCKALPNKYPDCPSVTESIKCQNLNYCYIATSNLQYVDEITQQLIDQNLIKCLRKTCDFYSIDQCDGQIIDTDICYLTSNKECKLAKTCDEIVDPYNDCSNYNLKNQYCFKKLDSKNCFASPDCQTLDFIKCQQYPEDCIFESTCKTIECQYFNTKRKCEEKKCEWIQQNKSCINSNFCSSQSNENCMNVKQNGKQCALIGRDGEDQFCSDIGCRYLLIEYSLCNGAEIGDEVCVPLSDSSCVSCQEIIDPCICLAHQDSCEYDRFHNICKSIQCESFNQDTCPLSRCQFNQQYQICIPFCQNNYNRKQCHNYLFSCIWDTEKQICTQQNKTNVQGESPINIIIINIYGLVLRIIIPILIIEF
ncbi:unnamed protein product [Paramecium primaurelia]|uniref:Transmembrane protein n=1 Tax=Paramecium primaurelia TaxID=5886 RepID=A0A8S1KUG9_PARPR|nr:unnamed protein product [Paramecium primaurelia]